jgi:hypothetical protein
MTASKAPTSSDGKNKTREKPALKTSTSTTPASPKLRASFIIEMISTTAAPANSVMLAMIPCRCRRKNSDLDVAITATKTAKTTSLTARV